MKSNPHKFRSGFSLVELMIVIGIMVILAAMGVGGFAFVQERQAKEKARVQIALLSKAIEEYKQDMGEYPGEAADSSQVLYNALFYEGYEFSNNPNRPDPNNLKATKIYLPELDPRTSKVGWVKPPPKNLDPEEYIKGPLEIIDPWKNNYLYRVGANAENPDFDLWSKGKDEDTDIGNSDMSQEKNKDDIRNF